MNHNDTGTLAHARRLAVQQHKVGRVLNERERNIVAYWVDECSPENFYMDGELFASND